MDMNEYAELLARVEKEMPLEAEKQLQRGGNVLKRMAQDVAPKDTGKLAKSFKTEMKGWSAENLECHIYSKAKHYHLIERGHVMKTRKGRIVGYKAGTFFFKKACDKFGLTVAPGLANRFFKKMKRKLNG